MNDYIYSPVVITGPSGAGKSELTDYITLHNKDFVEAIGVTTRSKRNNEKIKIISVDDFKKLIEKDELIEHCIYNGNYYGTPKEELKKLYYNYVIFNVGYSSAKVIKEMHNDSFMIYLLPPSKEELIKRLGDRDSKRYDLGIEETVNNAFKYDYLLISYTDEMEKIYNDFLDIIYQKEESKKNKLILAKNMDFVRNYYN